MPIHDKFFYVNIRDYLVFGKDDKVGEPMLARVLSGFSCPKNPDVERFLKKSAVEFFRGGKGRKALIILSWQSLLTV